MEMRDEGRAEKLTCQPEEVRDYRVRLARQMRQSPTKSENILWQALRKEQLDGWKFRHQRPIARFIADFCCDPLKLIIEIDGAVHNNSDAREYDTLREDDLIARGYTILRFSADAVEQNLESVLSTIRAEIEKLHHQK